MATTAKATTTTKRPTDDDARHRRIYRTYQEYLRARNAWRMAAAHADFSGCAARTMEDLRVFAIAARTASIEVAEAAETASSIASMTARHVELNAPNLRGAAAEATAKETKARARLDKAFARYKRARAGMEAEGLKEIGAAVNIIEKSRKAGKEGKAR